jgi:hypothetical protein
MLIVHALPENLPGGHLAYLTSQILNGLAAGYCPLASLCPLPPLYLSGIRYALEPNHGQGWEDFANPWTTLSRGAGDCDDLILYRLVELLLQGEHAHCRAEWLGNAVHVVIRRGNGEREDPSALLGAPDPNRR